MKRRIGYGFLLVAAGVLIARLFVIGNLLSVSSDSAKDVSIHRTHQTENISLFVYSAGFFSSEEDQDDEFIDSSFFISSIFSTYSAFSIMPSWSRTVYLPSLRIPFYIFIHAFRI